MTAFLRQAGTWLRLRPHGRFAAYDGVTNRLARVPQCLASWVTSRYTSAVHVVLGVLYSALTFHCGRCRCAGSMRGLAVSTDGMRAGTQLAGMARVVDLSSPFSPALRGSMCQAVGARKPCLDIRAENGYMQLHDILCRHSFRSGLHLPWPWAGVVLRYLHLRSRELRV